MTGTERREGILGMIKESREPVSARKMAERFGVSRQVIVQDVALLRAAGYDVRSTSRGYVLEESAVCSRVFPVSHTDEEIEDELCSIVDLGGRVRNVMVSHRVYGLMEAELDIRSRREVREFLENIRSGKSSPLKNITANDHYHRVEADSEQTLDLIEDALRKKRYLNEKSKGENGHAGQR